MRRGRAPRAPRAAAASAEVSEDFAAEVAQLADIKPPSFYAAECGAGPPRRRYFYYVDLQGRLFLEDTVPKNIATSLKSDKFLDFFWRQLRPNDAAAAAVDARDAARARKRQPKCGSGDNTTTAVLGDWTPAPRDPTVPLHAEYPWRSPCGTELNFVKAADRTAVVFQELRPQVEEGAGESASTGAGDAGWVLTWGSTTSATHRVPFDPSALAMSATSGRLFHCAAATRCGGVGLVKSHLALELSERIVPMSEEELAAQGDSDPGDSGLPASGFAFQWGGRYWPIRQLV